MDEPRIRQLLINLLNNALKFTLQGGSITLKVTQPFYDSSSNDLSQQCFVPVAVIDTGIGISPENINKLFQPFI